MAGRYDIYVQKGLSEDQTPLTSESPREDIATTPRKAASLAFGMQQASAAASLATSAATQTMRMTGQERKAVSTQNIVTGALWTATKIVAPKFALIQGASALVETAIRHEDRRIDNQNREWKKDQMGTLLNHHARGSSIFD